MQRLWSGDLLAEHWRYVIIDLLRLQSRQWLVLPSWVGVGRRGRVSRWVVLHGRPKRQTSVQSERRQILSCRMAVTHRGAMPAGVFLRGWKYGPVSYTHLTLPTICSV